MFVPGKERLVKEIKVHNFPNGGQFFKIRKFLTYVFFLRDFFLIVFFSDTFPREGLEPARDIWTVCSGLIENLTVSLNIPDFLLSRHQLSFILFIKKIKWNFGTEEFIFQKKINFWGSSNNPRIFRCLETRYELIFCS